MALYAVLAALLVVGLCEAAPAPEPEKRSSKCEAGWSYLESTHKCYKLFKDHTLWSSALINCRYEGADHVAIHTEEENKFVQELAIGEEPIWIGFAIFNGKFREWSDLSSNDYTNWHDGKNPLFDHGQMCTKMLPDGKWKISCCKKITSYICMKKVE